MRNRVELKFSYACQQGCSQEFLGLAPIAPPPDYFSACQKEVL